jgi:carbamoyl-phosphate synthase large subunit
MEEKGIRVPQTKQLSSEEDVAGFNNYPCVIKPATSSGASNLVFVAENEEESAFFAGYLLRRGLKPLLQEYIDSHEEYTIGVLSMPSGEIVGSIALKRFLEHKLSTMSRYDDRVISSGWSQGLIEDFSEVRQQAEKIARMIGSTWALNIQGRQDRHGAFYPFEINPRHSGTTYLRALAGFNEPHILLQRCLKKKMPRPQTLRHGYYLRSFEEKYVPKGALRRHD